MSSFVVLRKTSKKNTPPGKDKEETADISTFSVQQKHTLESYKGIWRIDLLDDAHTPFTLDGEQWNTVTHYICAQRFKEKAHEVYSQFTANSGSDICKDARKAEKQKSPAGMRLAKLKDSDVDAYRTRAIRAKLNDTPGLHDVLEVLRDTNTNIYVMGRVPGASKKLVPVEDRVYTSIMSSNTSLTGGSSSSGSSSSDTSSSSSNGSSSASSSSSRKQSTTSKTVKASSKARNEKVLAVASKEDEELYHKEARLIEEDSDSHSIASSATESDSDESDDSDDDSSEDESGDTDSDDESPDEDTIGGRIGEDDDDDDLVEYNAEQRNQRLLQQFHPEKMHLTENALRVVKKESFHKKTPPFLTRFEQTRILSFRTRQLLEGAQPYITVTPKMDSFEIAKEELKQRKIPYIIKRPLPDGTFDYHQLKSMSLSQRMSV